VTDEQLLEVIGERSKNRDTIQQLRTAMMGVIACFTSVTSSSTCVEDHHPSCLEYLKNVLKRGVRDE
jgi:hypothetical protein